LKRRFSIGTAPGIKGEYSTTRFLAASFRRQTRRSECHRQTPADVGNTALAGFALSPIAAAGVPEITTAITHLREVLGGQTYESLARKGEAMTTAEMVTYAYDQIDQARAELNAVSK
jgi:hypothetical protein